VTSTRRSSGESSIYQDEVGRWHGFVSMGLRQGGRRDRRHVSGQKRSAVVQKVRELEQKRAAGTGGTVGRSPTVEWWLTHWLDTIAARKVRPSTLEGYRSKVTSRLVPALGHHRLDRLQPEHVEAAWVEMESGGLAPATVLQCHRILSRALKVAVQRGRIARNVCTLVDSPALDRVEVEPLSATEARRLLKAALGARNAARWSVALALGLRQGETLGLAWSAVDLEAGTLSVRQALQRLAWKHGCAAPEQCGRAHCCPSKQGGGLRLVAPKSRAGRRTMALPAPLVDALKLHRLAQLEERIAAGPAWEGSGLVFCQVNGRPLDPSADHREWKSLLLKASVREARLHDARHTAATLLLQQGVPARVAMQILGHSQISLTLGTYSHVVPELAQEAAERMGSALWG
jgi:integrase